MPSMAGGTPLHGGPDALGVPLHDFSSNANACGPWPAAVQALRMADARHYPDPAYTALVQQLAAWHGVGARRVVIGASGSELIARLTLAVRLHSPGAPGVHCPAHAYGDYARAAQALGLPRVAQPAEAALIWSCDPSSPQGQTPAGLPAQVAALRPGQTLALDCAYAPLRLSGQPALGPAALARVWQLITPNKALGLTGVRAAYALAPADVPPALLAHMQALAPSWPLGAHGVALLQQWTSQPVHDWLHACRAQLRAWKAQQVAALQSAGWQLQPSDANFLLARPPAPLPALLVHLRAHGIKLRDCASFGLPGWVRVAVLPFEAQRALLDAWAAFQKR